MNGKQTSYDITTGILMGIGWVLDEARSNVGHVHSDILTTFVLALLAFID